MVQLVRLIDDGGNSEDLEGNGSWTVGRHNACDIVIPDDPYCPRRAFALHVTDGEVSLEPLSTSNELLVNGRAVSAATPLESGARIEFANQVLRIEVVRKPARRSASGADRETRHHRNPAPATRVQRERASAQGSSSTDGAPPEIHVGSKVRIGRSGTGNTVALEHPSVSRTHAELRNERGHLFLQDLQSTNGTYVNGKRIGARTELKDGDRVGIGPFVYRVAGVRLELKNEDDGSPVIDVVDVCVDVKHRVTGENLRLLDRVSISIPKGRFVCLVGSSGSGKTTLMNIMAARTLATAGDVNMKGLDLVDNFTTLRHLLAYVPQNNLLHEVLTLRQALNFAAQLRLPSDMDAPARARLVTDAAASVDIDQRLDMRIKDLSGGQKKRASLACETLSQPEVLFLDEVTSGLDEATDREIMRLLRRRADEGMTIVCVTHTLANVEAYCDTLVVMGRGGIPAYIGPPADALAFFGVERLGDLFDCLDAAEDGANYWRRRFEEQHGHKLAHAATPGRAAAAPAKPPKISTIKQFNVLTMRNVMLTLADRKNLLIALVQSVMIGLMLGYAFSDFGSKGQEVSSQISMAMALATAALWLGTNTAATGIVGEALIFQRERDVNVSTVAFVLSKFLVSGIFTVLQISLVFLLCRALAQDMPGSDVQQYGFLVFGAVIGVAMGLAISALSNTQEQANTIVPLALIPQLILAGVIVPALPQPGVIFSKISISAFWLTEGMKQVFIQGTDPAPQVIDSATGASVNLTAEPIADALIMLSVHLFTCLGGAIVIAVRRFSQKGSE